MRRLDGLVALVRRCGAAAARATVAVVGGTVARLAYRPHELLVLGLLASSLLGGLAVQLWREHAPGTVERLEAEPPPLPRAARPTRTHDPAQRRGVRPAAAREAERAPPAPLPSPERPLDLNRATAAELARLPGIGPRLAARILAQRDALGGFRSPDDLAGVPGVSLRTAARVRALVGVAAEANHRPAEADPRPTPEAEVAGDPP